MKISTRTLALSYLVIAVGLCSCKMSNQYQLSREDALSFNVPRDAVMLESFGAPGPYKFTNSIHSNPGIPFTFKVKVKDEWVERQYRENEGVFLHRERFRE